MKFLIFIAPNEFKDETVSMLKLFLDKFDIDSKITSYSTKECVGAHGAVYKPDINANLINPLDFDGIFISDGAGLEIYKLYEFRPLLDLMLKFNNADKYIIAIGNSVKILAKANIIKNKKISVPDNDNELKNFVLLFRGAASDRDIEIAGNIVTMKNAAGIDEPMINFFEHLGIR
ncbi:MAG: DJ-1/PfpI family protein [Candidatus Marsarchaeota archaeon]|nr:DJ-1/PfpI family protein [Candidatus Marsarchaeota archaeon]MCL5106106.1 DJ-1/PfpI family protein [Candidatus Marsarchaeota archaeon]